MNEKEEIAKRRRALKDTIDLYYAKEMLKTLLANGFLENEILWEFLNMMKRICKEEAGIKDGGKERIKEK
jgi:hypothetical protein